MKTIGEKVSKDRGVELSGRELEIRKVFWAPLESRSKIRITAEKGTHIRVPYSIGDDHQRR